MKRPLFLILFMFLGNLLIGQEFSFNLYFEDAIGNRDTLTIGYDTSATDSIDPQFGEVNIISVPLDNMLDVRITDEWKKRINDPKPGQAAGTFHTKKQIVYYTCGNPTDLIVLDIYCKNWPVTASWDQNLFYDACLNGTFITSCIPGGWWDVCGPSSLWRMIFSEGNTVQFTSNFDGNYIPLLNYINENYDTIPYFWMIFADSTVVISDIGEFMKDKNAVIYPNPVNDILNIQIQDAILKIEEIHLFDITGREIPAIYNDNRIDCSQISKGQYILHIFYSDEKSSTYKLVKNN